MMRGPFCVFFVAIEPPSICADISAQIRRLHGNGHAERRPEGLAYCP
jgi:hypothetical protein